MSMSFGGIGEVLGEWWKGLAEHERSWCEADDVVKGSSDTQQSEASYQLSYQPP